jgi:hypothetical protein
MPGTIAHYPRSTSLNAPHFGAKGKRLWVAELGRHITVNCPSSYSDEQVNHIIKGILETFYSENQSSQSGDSFGCKNQQLAKTINLVLENLNISSKSGTSGKFPGYTEKDLDQAYKYAFDKVRLNTPSHSKNGVDSFKLESSSNTSSIGSSLILRQQLHRKKHGKRINLKDDQLAFNITRPKRKRPVFQNILRQLKKHPLKTLMGGLALVGGLLYNQKGSLSISNSNLLSSFSFNNGINRQDSLWLNSALPKAEIKSHKDSTGKITYDVPEAPSHLPEAQRRSLEFAADWLQHIQNKMNHFGVAGLNQRLPVKYILKTDKDHNHKSYMNEKTLREADQAGGNQGVTILDRIHSATVFLPEEKNSLIAYLIGLGAKTAAEIARQSKENVITKNFEDVD